MNIQIKSRFTGTVLFEHDCEGNSVRLALIDAHTEIWTPKEDASAVEVKDSAEAA